MPRSILFAGAVMAAAVTLGSVTVHACTCAMRSTSCVSVEVGALFLGEVIAIAEVKDPDFWGSRRVTFAVRESCHGIDRPWVDVLTGSGGGDCGFKFTERSTYLVYASRHPRTGKLGTSICSGTKLASWAGDDLKKLRAAVRQLNEPVTVRGRVRRVEPYWPGTPRVDEPLAGAVARLDGQARSFDTRTSIDGRFEFRVPTGRYRLSLDLGDGFFSQPDVAAGIGLRVDDEDPCEPIEIRVQANRRIRGRLVDRAGRGVPFSTLEVAHVGPDKAVWFPEARTLTDGEGHFVFERLNPAHYVLGMTLRRFHQRDSGLELRLGPPALDLAMGTSVDAGLVRLPDNLDVHLMTGVVVDEAGAPVPNAEVRIESPGDESGVSSEPVFSDAQGRFVISAIAGRMHQLVAEDRGAIGDRVVYRTGKSTPFDAAAAREPFRLVVKQY